MSERVPGSMVALVTPFCDEGNQEINYNVLQELIRLHADSRTGAIVPTGTTGESPTLNHKEHQDVITASVEAAKGTGLKVIAGTGSTSTREAVSLTEHAAEVGADAALVVTPYYNRPSPRGVLDYYQQINRVGLPFYVYNLPKRTGINVSPQTMVEIVETCENAIGLKAANGILVEIAEVVRDCRKVRPGFEMISGDDSITLPILSVGGVGAISVIANFVPNLAADVIDLYLHGKVAEAMEVQFRMIPLARASMEVQSSPAGTKALLRHLGYAVGAPRSPMADVDASEYEHLVEVLQSVY